jgi:diguanylate cyclase (GGDEF)-like protein/PAS domain S-box-containing protein
MTGGTTRRTSRTARLRSLDDHDALRELVRNLREGIYITTSDGEILDANPAFLDMFGVASLEELRAMNAVNLVVDPAQRAEELELLARDGAIREFELQIRRVDGEIRTVLDTTYAIHDPDTGEVLFHGILIDITARKQLEEQLREQSLRDPLTGSWNRRYLDELGAGFESFGIGRWGCIFIDVDHFKQYNDRFGHEAGDVVLVKMSRFLSSQVRATESVVRVGGDEFVVVLPDADEDATLHVAERLSAAALHGAPVPFSLGWAARHDGESLQRTLGRADEKLLAVRVIERMPERRG